MSGGQLTLGGLGGIVLAPDTLEEQRGAWCSPLKFTEACGTFDLDPFTNPRSTLRAVHKCMLELGDDGFGLAQRDVPGTFYKNPGGCNRDGYDHDGCDACGYNRATEETKVWIQPDYEFVLKAIAHYGHTRFTALLRLDPSTEWFDQLWNMCEVIMVPRGDRIEFVPPPGVKASSNPFPHGLFYKRAADVTDAVRELCIPWACPRYPWGADPLKIQNLYFTTSPSE